MAPVKILSGIDFSESSIHALHYALNIFADRDVKLTIAFCYDNVLTYNDVSDNNSLSHYPKEDIEELYTHRLNVIKSDIETHFPKLNFTHTGIVVEFLVGSANEQLSKLAKAEDFDFMVMGLPTKINTISELMGTVVSDLIKRGVTPILAAPISASCNQNQPQNILYLADFSQNDFDAIHLLNQFFSRNETLIHCVHYNHLNQNPIDEIRMMQLQEYCNETYRNQAIKCELLNGESLIDSVNQYMQKNIIDLVTVTRTKRNYISRFFHPDSTKHLLSHCSTPLIVFNT